MAFVQSFDPELQRFAAVRLQQPAADIFFAASYAALFFASATSVA
jgi:hypothetical protein